MGNAKRFMLRLGLDKRLQESKARNTFFYADAPPDWATFQRFFGFSDLFIYSAGGTSSESFCASFGEQAGSQFAGWGHLPDKLISCPGFRILDRKEICLWKAFAYCCAGGDRSAAVLAVGGDSAGLYKAFFEDMKDSPAFLCLGEPAVWPGILGANIRPQFVITRTGEPLWPWKLM